MLDAFLWSSTIRRDILFIFYIIKSDVDPNFSVNNSLLVLGSSFKDPPIGVLKSVLQSEVASLVRFEHEKI